MPTTELQNKILLALNNKGNVPITFAELKAFIPDVSDERRIRKACQELIGKNLIQSFSSGKNWKVSGTVEGRIYTEKNLLTEKESTISPAQSYTTKEINADIKDKNIQPCFGVDMLADSFIQQIDRVSAADADNVCMIGIFGEWGRGKSYFFERVKKKLNERKESGQTKYTVIEFNAWKYQHTPAIWAYLFETIYKKASGCVKCRYTLCRNWYSFVSEFFLCVLPCLITIAISYVGAVCIFFKLNLITGIGGIGLFLLRLSHKHYNKALTLIRKLTKGISFSNYMGVQAEIEKELEHLLKVWISRKKANQKKILLYVDDIDRCPASKMMDIIESLRVVLENEQIRKRLIVVCSIDSNKLKADIRNRLKALCTSSEVLDRYVVEQLDKLFIWGIGLNELSQGQISNYISKLAQNDKEEKQQLSSSNDETPIDTNRLIGSIVATPARGVPVAQETDYAHMLEQELADKKGVTPRKARILYYRILFANNLISKNENRLVTKKLVHDIVATSYDYNQKTDTDQAYSDLVQMVVPY